MTRDPDEVLMCTLSFADSQSHQRIAVRRILGS
jgi:hypothetical protein